MSIKMTKVSGPRCDPCGIPAGICSQSDRASPIFTRFRRSCRNAPDHLTMTSGKPNATNLTTSTLWSTRSNALVKSIKTVHTDSPLSTAVCQWCSISTKASIVDRCLWAPNCTYLLTHLKLTMVKRFFQLHQGQLAVMRQFILPQECI